MYRIGDKVICINDDEVFLTLGKVYTILNINYNQEYYHNYNYLITNDREIENLYTFNRFISLKEYRKRKLNKIYENR